MNESLSSLTSELQQRVELTRPPYNSRWLSLLENCEAGGMRFKDQTFYEPAFLGFSHRANKLGLKGPDNVAADSVICGTSFALGVGVDQGSNWYELNDCHTNSLNIGFPVSNYDHLCRLDHLYHGKFERLIYIYHPNVWFTGIVFQKARQRGVSIFQSMRWDKMETQKFQYPKYLWRNVAKKISGSYRTARFNGNKFSLNSNYCMVDDHKYEAYLQREVDDVRKLFHCFKSVIVIRVPIKEEVFARHTRVFSEQSEQISRLWHEFCGKVKCQEILDLSTSFEPHHYHQFDHHWNKAGNARFAGLISELAD